MASAPELLAALVQERPDVGIVDVRLPPAHTAAGIFAKLDLVPSDDDNRRVLAVLAYLGS